MKEVNFTLGEGSDNLINDIALEKLWNNYDYDGAVSFLKDCLVGIQLDMIHTILLKKTRIKMDSEGMMNVDMDNLEQGVDINQWYYSKLDELEEDLTYSPGWNIKHEINAFIRSNRIIFHEISLLDYLYFCKNPKAFLDFLKDDEVVIQYNSWLNLINFNIEKVEKIFKIFIKFSKTEHELPSIYYLLKQCSRILLTLQFDDESSILEKHVKSELELNKIKIINSTTTLKDAGWISPKGYYYGLDGEVSNFIHIKIAELLRDSDIIPGNLQKPEIYLEEQGWIKQHDNKLYYAGAYYDLHILQEQIDVIKTLMSQKYTEICIDNREPISLSKFKQMDYYQIKKLFM